MTSRLPSWFRKTSPLVAESASAGYAEVKQSLGGLATVCEQAKCPNLSECWSGGTATVMLMGEECTRGCRFCAVKTSRSPSALNVNEGADLVSSIGQWSARSKLRYLVLTSVSRDDLIDQGSSHIAEVVRLVKKSFPDLIVEALVPDFQGISDCVDKVAQEVDVFSHNIETVERLQRGVRDRRAGYLQSLKVLERAGSSASSTTINPPFTKSSLMLGLGERPDEVRTALKDLKSAGVSFLTFGQYLRPTKYHLPVSEYITPEIFEEWKNEALTSGFKSVASGPLVRSSYRAGDFLYDIVKQRQVDSSKNIL